MLTCHWKQTFGVECPGCGFQRSFLKLFEGNFSESFFLFPATIPLLLLFVLLILHLIFRFKHGAYTLVGLFSLSTLLIVVNFIYKISQA
ncbi:MAG: hypothetical protein K0R65_644 [Crocinitomicaceae bacterium]|jgi:hypothetical protein|nr:hypothetical protein [Crocinitomicaceae bacterium]